jgi:hypothetical protein
MNGNHQHPYSSARLSQSQNVFPLTIETLARIVKEMASFSWRSFIFLQRTFTKKKTKLYREEGREAAVCHSHDDEPNPVAHIARQDWYAWEEEESVKQDENRTGCQIGQQAHTEKNEEVEASYNQLQPKEEEEEKVKKKEEIEKTYKNNNENRKKGTNTKHSSKVE